MDGLVNSDLVAFCNGGELPLVEGNRGCIEEAELAWELCVTALIGTHKDNRLIPSPICLSRVECLERIELDGHLIGLTSDILDECSVIENHCFPMESGIQRGDHIGILEI